jgi:hypothetical protein
VLNICDFRSDIFNILNGGFKYDLKIQDGISYKNNYSQVKVMEKRKLNGRLHFIWISYVKCGASTNISIVLEQ